MWAVCESLHTANLPSIKCKNTLGRISVNVRSVGKAFLFCLLYEVIWGCTWEINPRNVSSGGKLIVIKPPLSRMLESPKLESEMPTREKLYLCKECGKVFKQNSTLHSHAKAHTGAKPNMSTVGKPFIVNQFSINVQVHILERNHMNVKGVEKPLGNDITFSHMWKHTLGRNPMNMSIVGKRSHSEATFSHMGEYTLKSYECQHWGKAFRFSTSLRDHLMMQFWI